jgi:hypothetical protein
VSEAPWIMTVGVDTVSETATFLCKSSYRESHASPSRQRERYAFKVIAAQSGLEKLSAVRANSPSWYQPGGLQVSHCRRAKPRGSARTLSAASSTQRNHWYQNRRACAGRAGRPRRGSSEISRSSVGPGGPDAHRQDGGSARSSDRRHGPGHRRPGRHSPHAKLPSHPGVEIRAVVERARLKPLEYAVRKATGSPDLAPRNRTAC